MSTDQSRSDLCALERGAYAIRDIAKELIHPIFERSDAEEDLLHLAV